MEARLKYQFEGDDREQSALSPIETAINILRSNPRESIGIIEIFVGSEFTELYAQVRVESQKLGHTNMAIYKVYFND